MPKPLNVLILEDNEADAEMLLINLRKAGYKLSSQIVDNEKDFIAHLKPELDLILSDYNLPQFTGLEALHLRNASSYDIPFILISGEIGEDLAVECMREGADDYLFKDRMGRSGEAVSSALKDKTLRSENVRSVKNLRENEQFLTNVINAIQDGISVLDTELTITGTNKRMEEMYSDDMPLTGKKCYQVYQGRKSICPWCPSIKTLEDGKMHLEVVPYPNEENPTGWIELSSYPLIDTNEKINGVIESVRDITERKQAKKALDKKLEELITFQRLTVGRELKMIELKEEINILLDQAGKPPKYKISKST